MNDVRDALLALLVGAAYQAATRGRACSAVLDFLADPRVPADYHIAAWSVLEDERAADHAYVRRLDGPHLWSIA